MFGGPDPGNEEVGDHHEVGGRELHHRGGAGQDDGYGPDEKYQETSSATVLKDEASELRDSVPSSYQSSEPNHFGQTQDYLPDRVNHLQVI